MLYSLHLGLSHPKDSAGKAQGIVFKPLVYKNGLLQGVLRNSNWNL